VCCRQFVGFIRCFTFLPIGFQHCFLVFVEKIEIEKFLVTKISFSNYLFSIFVCSNIILIYLFNDILRMTLAWLVQLCRVTSIFQINNDTRKLTA